jgi:hypothetical protein
VPDQKPDPRGRKAFDMLFYGDKYGKKLET